MAGLMGGHALAQAALEQVVVSASRTEQRVQDALPATTLITRADIDAELVPDVPALLQRVAGVEIARNGGTGALSSSFIRGAESRHTLLLIDGVAQNNLNFGLAALEHVPLDSIERIEIVRGNVSSLYGSAAIGGVIQVFTRQAAGTPQANVSLQIGSYGTRQLDASVATQLSSGTRINASMESLEVSGFNALNQAERPGTNPDRDGYSRRAVAVGVMQDLGRLRGGVQTSTLGLRVREARGTTQYDSEYGPASQADESHYVERGAVLQAKFALANGLNLQAAWTRSEDKLDAAVTAYPYFVNSSSTATQVGLEWQFVVGQRVTAGLESTRQRIASDTTYNRSSRQQDSARLGYQADFDAHQVQLNLRQDRYSTFGSASTYFVGYAWRIAPAWRLNASSSTGFNAPTFNDLYYPYGGNPALHPERVKSVELGLQYAAMGHELRAVLFSNRYRDLIGNDATFTRVNVNAARNQGLELSYSGKLGNTGVHASATSQDPVDTGTGQRLSRRAAVLGKLSLTHDYGLWSTSADLRYSGARADGSKILASYALLDLGAHYAVSRELKASVRVDNLSDRSYETVYGYRQTGRSLVLGLNWLPVLK